MTELRSRLASAPDPERPEITSKPPFASDPPSAEDWAEILSGYLDAVVRRSEAFGGFVAKVFQGGATGELLDLLKTRFEKVRHYKPPASRQESAETFLIATGFKG